MEFNPERISDLVLLQSTKNKLYTWLERWKTILYLTRYWMSNYSADYLKFRTNKDFLKREKEIREKWKENIIVTLERGKLDESFINILKQRFKLPVPLPIPPYKPLLLIGPPGSGKTIITKVIAQELNANIILVSGDEITENKTIIERAIGVIEPPRVVVIDNADNINKRELNIIMKVIKVTRCPVIITLQTIGSAQHKALMLVSYVVFLDYPTTQMKFEFINKIMQKNNINLPKTIIQKLLKYPDFASILHAINTYINTRKLPPVYEYLAYNLYDLVRILFSIKKSDLSKTISEIKKIIVRSNIPISDLIIMVWRNSYRLMSKVSGLFVFYKFLADAEWNCIRQTSFSYKAAIDNLATALAMVSQSRNLWQLRKIQVDIRTTAREYTMKETELNALRNVAKLFRLPMSCIFEYRNILLKLISRIEINEKIKNSIIRVLNAI